MQKKNSLDIERSNAIRREQKLSAEVVVVLDNIRSGNNVGSFFRTCDALGGGRLMLCGISATPPEREVHKTALGAELTVAWEYFATTCRALQKLRAEGYIIYGVEQVHGATMLPDFRPEPDKRYAVVFGNEVEGVSDEALALCDGALEIPQIGSKHSLNVAVSGGIVIWHILNS